MPSDISLSEKIKTGIHAIDENVNLLHEVSKKIWERPELSFEEKYAHATLADFLEKQGFNVERHTPLETSFIAKFGNKNGIKVGVICEYDALPGIGHACGHNLIAEAGLAAGLGLKAILEANPEIDAEVVVLGTPAEEGGGGKLEMISKGCFDELKFCMMSHPGPIDAVKFPSLSRIEFNIVYHGKECHAAAAPWLGRNALDAAVQCYNNISMMRQQMLPSCRLHGIIKDGGLKPNIIPQRSELVYYVRGPTDKIRDELAEKLINCAKAAATATGCTVDITPDKNAYSNIKEAKILNALYEKHAMSLGIFFPDYMNLPGPEKDFAASTDMGNVSHIKPSIHPVFKICDAHNHTEGFTTAAGRLDAQKPTLDSAKAMMMMAIEVITDPTLLHKIELEFVESD